MQYPVKKSTSRSYTLFRNGATQWLQNVVDLYVTIVTQHFQILASAGVEIKINVQQEKQFNMRCTILAEEIS